MHTKSVVFAFECMHCARRDIVEVIVLPNKPLGFKLGSLLSNDDGISKMYQVAGFILGRFCPLW